MTKFITGLKAQSKNQNRISVYLDGQFAFGLSRIVAAWLEVGQSLSDEKINELLANDEQEVAYHRTLHFISIRQRSSSEVKQHLIKNKISPQLINETIDRLKANRLINDASFAQNWVENRAEFKPLSRRALSMELNQKGISRDVIDQTLENIDESAMAFQAALKHARKLSHLEWLEFRKKMLGFLARRGFSYDLASTAILRAWEELDSLELSSSPTILKR